MFHIKEHKALKTGSISSRLKFETDSFTRYLLLDNKRAYNLGLCCQTCSILFERLSGANQTVEIEGTAETLKSGVHSIDDVVVSVIGRGLPKGEYEAVLAETMVKRTSPGDAYDYFSNEQIALWGEDTFWCLPHDPRISYYRAGERDLGHSRRLFNFVVPMFPAKWLTMATVKDYMEALRTKASGTAVAIAVLEIKSPFDSTASQTPEITEHWCLIHYLLDGHHKLHAASESGRPLQLISFIALSEGISTTKEIETALTALRFGDQAASFAADSLRE